MCASRLRQPRGARHHGSGDAGGFCHARKSVLEAQGSFPLDDVLEQHRGNTVRSRNMRLAAIRTFIRFLALRAPESLAIATRVLAIPIKRADKKLIGALTRTEVEALLAAPDRSCWIGRRDHALLLIL